MERTDHLFERLAVRVKRCSLADFTFAKIGILAFGLLIGSWLPSKVRKYRPLLVLAFFFSAAYLAVHFFFGDDDDEEEEEDDYSAIFESDEVYDFADVEPLAEQSFEEQSFAEETDTIYTITQQCPDQCSVEGPVESPVEGPVVFCASRSEEQAEMLEVQSAGHDEDEDKSVARDEEANPRPSGCR